MNYEQEKINPYEDGVEKAQQVEQMFNNIAPTYDKLNHRLSWNIDKGWRKKAIRSLKPFEPKILLDIAMPAMDGIQTLSVIRKNPAYTDMKVIFLTAAADKDTIIKASQLKIADYVKKPFTPDDLIARVEKQIFPPIEDPEVNDIFKALDNLGL